MARLVAYVGECCRVSFSLGNLGWTMARREEMPDESSNRDGSESILSSGALNNSHVTLVVNCLSLLVIGD
ncbi:MAG: hypothetical protein JWM55_2176 [Acidimicrobiaceae bacterium]|nr:hypothetical protein [Acidimicrobiaceae bacterium]